MSSIERAGTREIRSTEQTLDQETLNGSSFGDAARVVAASVAALLVGVGTAEASEPKGVTPIVSKSLTPREATAALMEKRITLESRGSTLEDTLAALGAMAGVKIEPLWEPQGASVGLKKDLELEVSLQNVTTRAALERIAEIVGREGEPTTWQVLPDGRLQFGTKASLDRFQERRIYDVRDLGGATPQFLGAPRFNFNGALQQGGGGGSIIGEPEDREVGRRSEQDTFQTIKELIQETIESDQWIERGGSGGSIRFYNGTFIVVAAPYVHRALGL